MSDPVPRERQHRLAGIRIQRIAAAFLLAAVSYLPTLRRYGLTPLWALTLPLIASFYMAATLGSALAHWNGRGANWKNRAYGTGINDA